MPCVSFLGELIFLCGNNLSIFCFELVACYYFLKQAHLLAGHVFEG
ncbi:MAG: hypothetical protein ACI9LX_001662 [Paraglaciecola sp.]|jgi:hypothetical protein